MMDGTLSDARSSYDIGQRCNRSHDLLALLTKLEHTIAGVRRRTILFTCCGVIVRRSPLGLLPIAGIAAGGSAGVAEAELMVTERSAP